MLEVIYVISMLGFMALVVIVMIRIDLVFCIRQKAINASDDNELETIFIAGPSYDEMVWDFRKWTFKQFYPELAGRVAP